MSVTEYQSGAGAAGSLAKLLVIGAGWGRDQDGSSDWDERPKGLEGRTRELRIDWYVTRLWLFHDGAEIRRLVADYLERERGGGG